MQNHVHVKAAAAVIARLDVRTTKNLNLLQAEEEAQMQTGVPVQVEISHRQWGLMAALPQ